MALNKGNIYISKTSPPVVREAYLAQFQEDFTMFLKSRSEEVVPCGSAVLILHGRKSPDPSTKECCATWDLIAEAIAALVSEGIMEAEQLDSFNVPYYTPSPKEVQDVVEREGSFAIEHIDSFAVHVEGNLSIGEKLGRRIRVFTESIVAHHFGEKTMEKIYDKLTQLLVENLSIQAEPAVTVVVVLNKNK